MAITKQVTEIKIGAAEIKWNDITIGHTEEGSIATLTKDLVARTVDQFGSSVVDEIVVGEHITIEAQIAQWAYDILQILFPESTKGTGDYVMVGSVPGQKLGDSAQEVTLVPYAATGATEDVIIHKAVAQSAGPIPYSNDADRLIPVVFEGLLDPDRQDGDRLYQLWAPAAGA